MGRGGRLNAPVQINPQAQVKLRRVGREGQPLLVIDDVVLEPETLVAMAADAPFAPPTGTYYPGLNAPLPRTYLETLLPVLRPSFERAFGIAHDTPLVANGFFALATHRLEDFGPWQKIPHYDQLRPDHLAMVHYLCPGQAGGTAFFRHRTTGFESVDLDRREVYLGTVQAELDRDGDLLTGYTGPQTPNFEITDSVEIRFNRLVLYRSNVLHCALFDGAKLEADVHTGRLTANSFFRPR
ncbi:histidyl-tRNA synthetase, class IIA [Asticcacaulis biprosthecium C19]|uniref:Histidyl-tRNA synthetase, class IIA n=1 Tax=Asticcacaulis biprosthecium C19 TaxID=715226 RepID=F4QMS6_9CAUL|nr:DUF6445 family protein [Asticcacaulis biprosthecium]EGF91517.1 histidyl-tRNA synthetase, class IIA [Asticcacaulis biprosthecium C19]